MEQLAGAFCTASDIVYTTGHLGRLREHCIVIVKERCHKTGKADPFLAANPCKYKSKLIFLVEKNDLVKSGPENVL